MLPNFNLYVNLAGIFLRCVISKAPGEVWDYGFLTIPRWCCSCGCLDLPLCLYQKLLVLKEMFCTCALREMLWSAPLNRLWSNYRNVPAQRRLELSESDLCFITMLRPLPNKGFVLYQAQFWPDAKEHRRLHMAQLTLAVLETSTPFLEPQWCTCLLPLRLLLPSWRCFFFFFLIGG